MWVCDRLAQRPGWRPYDLVDGVAMLPVSGLIVPELGAIGCSAATGCAELLWLASMAGADPDVRGIALMVDSGGGEVNGVDEAARALRRLDKPVAAVVTGDAYSAAYWLASAADSIAVARTGGVGSIGIIAEHWDDSAYLGRLGIARTVVARGDRKADFHPTLTAEGRAQLDAEVKALRAAFVDTVARHRAIDAGAVLATKSRSFKGADQLGEARQLGLIDAIAFPDEALTAFGAFLMRPAA
jgi:ClpP class serine protease